MVSNISLISSKRVTSTTFFKEYRVANESDIASIFTEDLAVGSSVIVANSTVDFHQWNGTAWIKAD